MFCLDEQELVFFLDAGHFGEEGFDHTQRLIKIFPHHSDFCDFGGSQFLGVAFEFPVDEIGTLEHCAGWFVGSGMRVSIQDDVSMVSVLGRIGELWLIHHDKKQLQSRELISHMGNDYIGRYDQYLLWTQVGMITIIVFISPRGKVSFSDYNIFNMSFPSIHDAYGGFGDKSNQQINPKQRIPDSKREMAEGPKGQVPADGGDVRDNGKYPSDAGSSNYPIKIRCPKCNNVCMTRMNSEMGAAAWVWCVLLAPFACAGISCLCFESCRDKIHFCTRCGAVVGKKFAKVC